MFKVFFPYLSHKCIVKEVPCSTCGCCEAAPGLPHARLLASKHVFWCLFAAWKCQELLLAHAAPLRVCYFNQEAFKHQVPKLSPDKPGPRGSKQTLVLPLSPCPVPPQQHS